VLEAARLRALIANVLDLGRAERGERAWDRRPLDLGALVAEVIAPFRLAARREGIELEAETSPHEAVADRDAIAQALLNVLDNARKYAALGKRIAVRQRGGRVEVRDYGPGVPDRERERIFEKLRRGRAQQDGHVPGLGLGLHLAREIARAHGGSLRHEPPRDGGPGSCFVLELP
jgi:signal transduction histidine kinase